MKELFIQHHENLIARYLDLYPDKDYSDAYEATSQEAYDTLADYVANMNDYYEDAYKEAQYS